MKSALMLVLQISIGFFAFGQAVNALSVRSSADLHEARLLDTRGLSGPLARCSKASTCSTNLCQFGQCKIAAKGDCSSTGTWACQLLTTCSASKKCLVPNGLPALNNGASTCASGYCSSPGWPFAALCLCSDAPLGTSCGGAVTCAKDLTCDSTSKACLKPIGGLCSKSTDCGSKNCVDSKCAVKSLSFGDACGAGVAGTCPAATTRCTDTASGSTCLKINDQSCADDTECVSGLCSNNGKCTATGQGLVQLGQHCKSAPDCNVADCLNGQCLTVVGFRRPCGTSQFAVCYGPLMCTSQSSGPDICLTNNNQQCTNDDSACASGLCVDAACKARGSKSLVLGQHCLDNTDCADTLVCTESTCNFGPLGP